MKSLRLLHLNDLHSHFGQFPKIERFFAENSKGETDVFRFDLGDNVDRVHPLTEATNGRFNIEQMNRLNLTAATLGNNEGLGLSHDMLSHLYDNANFDLLLSNLTNTPFGKAPKIVETSWGLRVGIIGLTAPYELAYPLAGWDLEQPMTVLEELLPLENCDFTILLSHLGKPRDEAIAERFPEIDLIIGSHTHHLFENGAKVNETLLAAAGRYGEHVGQIDLTFDDENHLISSEIEAIPTSSLPALPGDMEQIKAWEDEGHRLLSATRVNDLPAGMTNTAPDYPASHYLAGLFAKAGGVERALINSGLLVTDYLPKELDLDKLHDFLPHSIRLVRFSISGAELKAVLAEIMEVSTYLKTQKISGMGFRGKTFGELIFYNLEVDSLVDSEVYSLVMPDQYLFARYFPRLKAVKEHEILFPDFLREVVEHELGLQDCKPS